MNTAEKTNRILIAEDQEVARLGLRVTLEKMAGMQVVGEAVDGESVIKQVGEVHPNIILMDINLLGMDGIEATKRIKHSTPDIGILMFTADSSDDTVFAALGAGADGYCLKDISADQLRTAIDSVAKGAAWLDPGIAKCVLRSRVKARSNAVEHKAGGSKAADEHNVPLDKHQTAILELVEQGLSVDQIANRLHMAQSLVELKLRSILGGAVGKSSVQPGAVLSDRFAIESVIGSGGICTVYKGKHLTIGRPVAVKMLHQRPLTTDMEVKRFLQEARAASAISHANVVTIFDFGLTPEGQPYMVMDYIDGVSLEQLIKEQKLTVHKVLAIFIQVCDALAAAHKRGILHRDLKPSNIMLVKDDAGADMVKLVDFGMAKFIVESEDLKLSKTGDLCGTPLYMSPEHFKGTNLDARSDIYSLGCVMYEALTGNPPFSGISVYEMMNAHINEEPSRLPFLRPGKSIPTELETLLFKMLAKDPAQRPQSVTDIKSELSRIQTAVS